MNEIETHKIEASQNAGEQTPVLFEGADTALVASLKSENEELKASIRMRDAHEQVTASLKSAGARSPKLLFEAARESLQFGEDGSLVNTTAIVAELKHKFPEQFGSDIRTASIDGGAGTLSPSNILTKEALAKMKPAEIARLDWADVRQVLSDA